MWFSQSSWGQTSSVKMGSNIAQLTDEAHSFSFSFLTYATDFSSEIALQQWNIGQGIRIIQVLYRKGQPLTFMLFLLFSAFNQQIHRPSHILCKQTSRCITRRWPCFHPELINICQDVTCNVFTSCIIFTWGWQNIGITLLINKRIYS